MRRYPEKLKHHDQDALNAIFAGNYKELSAKYNFIPMHTDVGIQRPFIVHFAEKPWYFFSAVPYREEYFCYLKKTPWKENRFRGLMDISFMRKYHFYGAARFFWRIYKRIKK
jgi:lipopolysaccharide biosynthesis glycosyltransferase